MEAGYKAARRGYWQEALLRFETANALRPQDGRVLNNLALALEAVGRYEEALATYERGLTIDPGDRNLKRNHARFKELYASLIAEPEEDEASTGDDKASEGPTAEDAEDDDEQADGDAPPEEGSSEGAESRIPEATHGQ
jgi:tetratricopeptide (TPR) repeat protein